MARSMACELGPRRIRVNSLSPGHIYTKCVFPSFLFSLLTRYIFGADGEFHLITFHLLYLGSLCSKPVAIYNLRSMTAAYLDTQPHLLDKWASLNPLGRIGRPDELRGVVTWLASDASTFCTGSEYVLPSFQLSEQLSDEDLFSSIIVSGGHHSW